jgi:hypothetical protein
MSDISGWKDMCQWARVRNRQLWIDPETLSGFIACAEALDSVVTLASHSAEVAELAFREARAAIAQLRAAP